MRTTLLSLFLVLALVSSARAESWKMGPAAGELNLPIRTCGVEIQAWAWRLEHQKPIVSISHDVMTLEIDKAMTVSDRALIGADTAWGFWDSPPWSDQGVTLMVRIHPKPGPTAKVELILIQRRSVSDRGDACFVEIVGDAQRR